MPNLHIRRGSTTGRGGSALKRLLLVTGTSAVFLCGGSAFAQTTEPASGGVEEIVVTARRTAEKLQDVPLAVVAFTDRSLRANNVVNLQSLNGLTPSLNYQSSGSRNSTGRVFFRGLTTGAGGQATRASIFLDGNYIAGSAQNIPFNYFERVEALPGPQSAQYGRATFGGAINYVTKDPTSTLSGVVHADYATFNDIQVDGFVGGPIFDKALGGRMKASVFASYQKFDAPDGWKTPADVLHPDGVRQGAQESSFVGLKDVFNVSDDLTIRLSASYAQFHDQPGLFFLTPPGPLKNTPLQRYTGNDLSRPIAGSFLFYPTGSLDYGSDYSRRGLGLAQNFYNIADPRTHSYNQRYSGQILWRVANHDVTVNAQHEFERNKSDGSDTGNTYFPTGSFLDLKTRIVSDSVELRIASPTERRLRYTVGAYFLNFSTATTGQSFSAFRCTNVVVGCTTNDPRALFNPRIVNGALEGFTGTAVAVNTFLASSTLNETTDKSVFGMLSYDLTQKLVLAVEGRYQAERLVSQNRVTNFRGDETFTAFVPRVSVQYRFTPRIQAFGVFSIGNNPGGFNANVASFLGLGATTADLSFKEEKLRNYELGIKSTLFGGRVVANATVFNMDWVDQVANETRASTTGVFYTLQANRGTSRVRGGEIQLTVAPVKGLTLNGTLSYNQAKYVNYCSASAVNIAGYVTPGRLGCVVVDGNFLENVPATTASFPRNIGSPVGESLELVFGGNYRYREGQWESDLNLGKSAAQNLVDLRIGVESGRITATLFCSNCTNEMATDRATNLADDRLGVATTTNRTVSFAPRRPRQFGIRTAYRF